MAVLLGFEKGVAGVFPIGMIRKSHFTAPTSDKINHIFWHLSTYALHLSLAQHYTQYNIPQLPLPPYTHSSHHLLFHHRIQSLQYYIMREMRKFVGLNIARNKEEEKWKHWANQLTDRYQDLQQQLVRPDTILQSHSPPFFIVCILCHIYYSLI